MDVARLEKILTCVFRHEEINGGERCPTYLHRWTLLQPRWPRRLWRGFGIYLHKFVGDDWSRDLHDHPKRFISIGLQGRYLEWTPNDGPVSEEQPVTIKSRVYQAPWVRTFPAAHTHRLELIDGASCWTLVIVLWHVREWGSWRAAGAGCPGASM